MKSKSNRGVLIGAALLFSLVLQPGLAFAQTTEKARPPGVPQEAIWLNGQYGGHFYACNFVQSGTSTVFCKIFDDVNGRLLASGYLHPKKPNLATDMLEFYSYISGYDGSKIVMSNGELLKLHKKP